MSDVWQLSKLVSLGRIVVNSVPQEMRTFKEAEAAGKAVGFELVDSRDIAHTSPPAGHW